MAEKKVYVIHENLEWTQHLVKWLEEKKVPYELWDLSKGILNLQEAPPEGVFYNRMSASSHTRGHRYAPEYTEQVLSWLTRHGRKVVNGLGAINLEISKVKQYLALEENGIPHPKTVAVLGQDQILEGARQLNTYPLITKHNRAGKGLGVQLFQNEGDLEAYVNSPAFEPSVDGITLLQEYIKPADGRIRRSEFIGQKFLYTVSIDSSDARQTVARSERRRKSWKAPRSSKLQNPWRRKESRPTQNFCSTAALTLRRLSGYSRKAERFMSMT